MFEFRHFALFCFSLERADLGEAGESGLAFFFAQGRRGEEGGRGGDDFRSGFLCTDVLYEMKGHAEGEDGYDEGGEADTERGGGVGGEGVCFE